MADTINDLKAQIGSINDRIERGGLSSVILDTLNQNKEALQSQLDRLLQGKGIVKAENKAFESLQIQERDKAMTDFKQSKTIVLVVGVLVVAGIGFYIYNKNKKP